MMLAGPLDRRIEIRRFVETGRNNLNEPVGEWQFVRKIWAKYAPERGSERVAAMTRDGTAIVRFRIRYRDLKVKDRLIYRGLTYEVIAPPVELGRREGLEVHTMARDNG